MSTPQRQTDLWHVNKDKRLQVHLHPGQSKAWNSEKRFVTICAGTQSGKTSFGPVWLYREIQQRGPGDYLVAAPTFPLLSLKLLPEFKRFFEAKLKLGKYVGSPNKVFTFNDHGETRLWGEPQDVPTQVFFGHAQDPDSLESATAKAAWLDEAGQKKFKRGSFEAILRRLSIHEGRVLTTTTPYSAFGWFKTELHDKARTHPEEYELVNFESRMNPLFPEDEWDRARRDLPRWKFDLMYKGKLTKPAGLILDCWQDDYEIPSFPPPDVWARYSGVDFGGVNTCALAVAVEPAKPETIIHVYSTYYPQMTKPTEVYASDILRLFPRIPTAAGGARREGQWRTDFRQAGLPLKRPLISDVEVGINHIYKVIQNGRLRVHDNCQGLIEEIHTYSRKLDDNDNPTDEIEDKNSFHHIDALRYIIPIIDRPIRVQQRDF